jgi:hypothetical protein
MAGRFGLKRVSLPRRELIRIPLLWSLYKNVNRFRLANRPHFIARSQTMQWQLVDYVSSSFAGPGPAT